MKKGMTVMKEEDEDIKLAGFDKKMMHNAGIKMPDSKKSKAIPQRSYNIYVNLKGRDPDGIVDPEDYEQYSRKLLTPCWAIWTPKQANVLLPWHFPNGMPGFWGCTGI
jgi:hypothetical protein